MLEESLVVYSLDEVDVWLREKVGHEPVSWKGYSQANYHQK